MGGLILMVIGFLVGGWGGLIVAFVVACIATYAQVMRDYPGGR